MQQSLLWRQARRSAAAEATPKQSAAVTMTLTAATAFVAVTDKGDSSTSSNSNSSRSLQRVKYVKATSQASKAKSTAAAAAICTAAVTLAAAAFISFQGATTKIVSAAKISMISISSQRLGSKHACSMAAGMSSVIGLG